MTENTRKIENGQLNNACDNVTQYASESYDMGKRTAKERFIEDRDG